MANFMGQSLQNGKYTLNEELGQGGFGITYKATNLILNQVVVIKTLNSLLRENSKADKLKSRFKDEARRLAKCSHPNIVRVSDFFIEDELPYIVMEYIPGLTLKQIVLPDNPLPENTALNYIRQAGKALKVVHQEGLLHRDIKPENLLLRQGTEQVVLIDFGIAREFQSGAIQTHTNYVSEGYAPIEQYLPKAVRTPAIDVYGLAATLYTLLTARIPLSAIRRQDLPPLDPRQVRPNLSNWVSQAVICGMNLEPEDRPASVEEWLALLPKTVSSSRDKNKPPSLMTTQPVILQQQVGKDLTNVKLTPIVQAQKDNNNQKTNLFALSGDRQNNLLKKERIKQNANKNLNIAFLSVVSQFSLLRQRKVMAILVTAILTLGGWSLVKWRFSSSELPLIREEINEFEPTPIPQTFDEEYQPSILEKTLLSPPTEIDATSVSSPLVDEIPLVENKLPQTLSKPLVQEQKLETEKSQSKTSTPVDEALSIEPKKIPIPPKTAPNVPEIQIRETQKQREKLKKQAEQQRERLKKQAERQQAGKGKDRGKKGK